MSNPNGFDYALRPGSLIRNEIVRIEAERKYREAIEQLNRTTDREINEALSLPSQERGDRA